MLISPTKEAKRNIKYKKNKKVNISFILTPSKPVN